MAYTKVGWVDSPSTATPLSAENLEHMDAQIKANEEAIKVLQETPVVVTDDAFDTSSDNPVANRVVANAISELSNSTSSFQSNLENEIYERQAITLPMSSEMEDARTTFDYVEYETVGDAIRAQATQLNTLLGAKIDGGYSDENGYLILTSNGVPVGDPIGPFAGGGGGGGGSSTVSTLSLVNTSGWLQKSISESGTCVITATWSSTLDEIPTGAGELNVTVNLAKKVSRSIAQGPFSIDLTKYLNTGTNTIRVSITDAYAQTRYINYTVIVVALTLKSTFDNSTPVTGAFIFPYTPTGIAEKTVHFELDGTALPDVVTSSSGRQMTLQIAAQTHGKHTLKCWFDATIDGAEVSSNELYYEFAATESGNNTPVIWSDWDTDTVAQYETVLINYYVYSNTLTTPITITLMDGSTQQLTVDRQKHALSTKALTVGNQTISITAGATTYTVNITVTESSIEVNPVTDDMSLYLSAAGRSNNEANPGTWTYEDVSVEFTGFNWSSDGWRVDDDGNTACRVSGDGRLTVNSQIFARDFKQTGKTISVMFRTSAVRNYNSTIISCMNGGEGFTITPQSIHMSSLLSAIDMQFKEDELVRADIVVEKSSENRLIYLYINGIMSQVRMYPANDDFSQSTPVGISIGSNDAITDIYCIRVYDNDLTRHQVLQNWIADTQVVDDMLERYNRNNVFDAYSQIVISKLPTDLPYLTLVGSELPQSKGDKKTVSGSFTDPSGAFTSFTFTGAQIDVQGTSSQGYARKNYKIKFKNGFDINGTNQEAYAMRPNSIPTSTFTMKADVASSEGANNVELVRLYEDMCPYKTPAQVLEPNVRQGIDGFPIVIFYNDGTTTTFMGKYNFNNDKGTEEVFGFAPPDESWEVLNNTSNRTLFKSADFTSTTTDPDGKTIFAWQLDFEGRYPDGSTDSAQLAEFAAWVVSTDPDQATNANLASSVTYDGVTYTKDTSDYRLAKFKAEVSDYCELESALFYYLFTEAFLMVDSRAKNAFPSFVGSEVGA